MEYKCIVDRIEEDKVVIEFENKEMGMLPKSIFPKYIKEGNIVIVSVKNRISEGKIINLDEYFK